MLSGCNRSSGSQICQNTKKYLGEVVSRHLVILFRFGCERAGADIGLPMFRFLGWQVVIWKRGGIARYKSAGHAKNLMLMFHRFVPQPVICSEFDADHFPQVGTSTTTTLRKV